MLASRESRENHRKRIPSMNPKQRLLIYFQFLLFPLLLHAQTQELAIDRGIMGLTQVLDRLPYVPRVMFVAAHPDDENSGVLPYVSRGLRAKTALLALTRGEGGQNLIGPDLFEALGLIRTGEMMAAVEYYGVQQFFTRAFDFGFSKSSEETLQKWGKEAVLSDMVRAIRQFRPYVIISVWQGNKSDGHGHHQAAGLLAREAFQAAGDPVRFPELNAQGLHPWKPQKLYIRVDAKEQPTTTVDPGRYVPLLGASYQEIASEGYSSHRSQGSGDSYSPPGSRLFHYRLLFPEAEGARGAMGFLDAGTIVLQQLAQVADFVLDANYQKLLQEFRIVESSAMNARARLRPEDFSDVVEPLLQGLTKLREIREDVTRRAFKLAEDSGLLFLLKDKEREFERALELSAGTYFEALASDAEVTPGQSFAVSVTIANRSSEPLEVQRIDLMTEPGWKQQVQEGSLKRLMGHEKLTLKFSVTVAPDAKPSVPHWKRSNKQAALYTVDEPSLITAPLMLSRLSARVDYEIRGTTLSIVRPVEYLDRDPLKGTRKIALMVVPALQLEVTPQQHLVSTTTMGGKREVLVKVVNNVPGPLAGDLLLQTPAGWRADPAKTSFTFAAEGEAASFRFLTQPTGKLVTGRTAFKVSAVIGSREIRDSYKTFGSADLWRFPLYRAAASEMIAFDFRLPARLKVAYVMGAGDRVPETLEQLGIAVKLLTAEDLASGDLRSYDCIIAGVRAYDVRTDLIANNARLLDYVKQGGVFLVQYNRKDPWNKAQYAPYPAKIASNDHRVTDENAPVTILDGQHTAFNFPNKITTQDFEGWVQERGLYFIQERDPRFKALLASGDPGEKPLDGGLLVADYGAGKYVLSSLAWFRQLPEGVPGAIRLFANLISLGRAEEKGERVKAKGAR